MRKRKLAKLEAKIARTNEHVERTDKRIRERRQEAGMIDLTVTGYCDAVYELTREIEAASPADDVSRSDYLALAQAVRELYDEVRRKLASE